MKEFFVFLREDVLCFREYGGHGSLLFVLQRFIPVVDCPFFGNGRQRDGDLVLVVER